ncbi:MAG: hypothetical protein HRT88_10255, partial [Lentisphaeraceae bacterium]|nr:hypothetical protein [Lentisphaeraceae bacterium]
MDKRLMSLAFTIGLTIPTFAQDGNSSVNTSDEIASALISTEKPISAIAKVEEITKEQKEKEASIKHQHASELHKAKNYAAAINSYVKSIELYSQVSATHPRIVEKVASMRIDLAKVYKEYAEILIQDGQSSADIMKLEQAEMFLEKSQKNDKRLELYVFNRKETLRSLKKQAEFINAANPQGANKRAEELLVEKKWRYDQAQLMITNKRYMDAKPKTEFCGMSGTLTSKGLHDYAHLSHWALKDTSPIPRIWSEVDEWNEALGTTFAQHVFQRCFAPLIKWARSNYPG